MPLEAGSVFSGHICTVRVLVMGCHPWRAG